MKAWTLTAVSMVCMLAAAVVSGDTWWNSDRPAGAVWSDAGNWSAGLPDTDDRANFVSTQATTYDVDVDTHAVLKKILISQNYVFNGTGSIELRPASTVHWDKTIEVNSTSAVSEFNCDVKVVGTTDYVMDIRNYGTLTFNGTLTLTNEAYSRPINFNASGTTIINGDLHNDAGLRMAGSTVRIGGSGTTVGFGALTLGSGRLELNRPSAVINNSILINGSTVVLGADNALISATDIDLVNGTLTAQGHNQEFGTLDIGSNDVVFDMGSMGSLWTFEDSSSLGWGGGTLTITNADYAAIRFAGTGLSSAQIGQIIFNGQALTTGDTIVTNGYLYITPVITPLPVSLLPFPGDKAEIQLSAGDVAARFLPGTVLFSDRGYILKECPPWLEGKLFIRNSIDTNSFSVTKSGLLTVLVPDASPQASTLESLGFTRIDPTMTFQLFGDSVVDQVRVYQKDVSSGESYQFPKWTVVLGFSNENQEEVLYNGIELPQTWPPENISPTSFDAMPVPYLDSPPDVIPIDIGRQLFVDDFLIESTVNVNRSFHYPEEYSGNPVLVAETDWELNPVNDLEAACPLSGGLWWDPEDSVFKLWYSGGFMCSPCYAESTDGVNWVRPSDLGVFPGSNKVFTDIRADSWSVVRDWRAADPDATYKIFQRPPGGDPAGAYCFESADGITVNQTTFSGVMGDRSTAFYNPFRDKWVYSLRTFAPGHGRTRRYWEGDDFLTDNQWDSYDLFNGEYTPGMPVIWAAADALDPEDPELQYTPQLYNLDAVAYESIMLGFYQIWRGPDNDAGQCTNGIPKITELNFAYSRDGFHWDRPDRTTAIASSREAGTWNRGYVQSLGNICVLRGDKIWFYHTGFAGDESRPDVGMYANGAMGIATLRRDGFASMDSSGTAGTLLTRPLVSHGKYLFVNADIPDGSLRAEIVDANGTPVSPFTLANSVAFSGDKTIHQMTWAGGSDLSSLFGDEIRIRFEIDDGSLYSFWISKDETGRSDGYVAGGGPGYTGISDTVGIAAVMAEKELSGTYWKENRPAGAAWSDADNWFNVLPDEYTLACFVNAQSTTYNVDVDTSALTKKMLISQNYNFNGSGSIIIQPSFTSHWDKAIEVTQGATSTVFNVPVTTVGTTDFVMDIYNSGTLTFNGSLTLTNTAYSRPVNFSSFGTTAINGNLYNHCGIRMGSSSTVLKIGGSGTTVGSGGVTLGYGRLELNRPSALINSSITLSGTKLVIGANNALVAGTDVNFLSGTILAMGYNQTFGTLDIGSNDVTIDMNNSDSVFTFGDSSATEWGGGRLLIKRATGAAVRFPVNGLSSAQIEQIVLNGKTLSMEDTTVSDGYLYLDPDHFPYTLDQPILGSYLNQFWNRYGMSEGPPDANGNEAVVLGSSGWYEWNAMKVAWTDHNLGCYNDSASWIRGANVTGIDGVAGVSNLTSYGFVWSSNHSTEGQWMAGEHDFFQFHYDQIPHYICAIYRTYMWGRDYNFLTNAMPKAEAAMYYLLTTMQGTNGLVICPGDNNGLSGTPGVIEGGGTPSTYMDNVRSGHKDAWINAIYYTALQNMAELEEETGDAVNAALYRDMATSLVQTYSQEFWDGNQFAAWKDINGDLHGGASDEIGYTYVNIEALARGLGSPWRAHLVYKWLDNETSVPVTQPTVVGAYAGSTNIYQAVVAPRTVTARIPDDDFCEWTLTGRYAAGSSYFFGYGNHMQDGGTILYYNYYDVMGRLKWLDADNAYTKLGDMLYRCALEGHYMSNGPQPPGEDFLRPTNSYGDYYLAVGTSSHFPESGISGLSMLYGFMGVEATLDGLEIAPKLPSRLLSVQCADTYFGQTSRTIRVARGEIVDEVDTTSGIQVLNNSSDWLSQDFTATSDFNELGVFLGNYQIRGARSCNASLYQYVGGVYRKVATRRIVAVDDNAWTYFTFPKQQVSGTQQYRITLSGASGGELAWYWDENGFWSSGMQARNNGTAIGGCYRLRLIHAPQTSVLSTSGNSTAYCPAGGKLQAHFSTVDPFSRVSIGVYSNNLSECTLTLERVMGVGQYRTVASQQFYDYQGSGQLTLTLADQPAAEYILTLSEPSGTVGWDLDTTSGSSDIWNSVSISSVGTTNTLSGDLVVNVERGQYTISVTPGLAFSEVVDAGDSLVFTGEMTPGNAYAAWASVYNLDTENAMDADPDGDSVNNLIEYALGGNPTNPDVAAVLPLYGLATQGGSNWLEYVYRRRLDAMERGLTYEILRTTNLVTGEWISSGIFEETSGIDDEFEAVTNRISTEFDDKQFMKLNVEMD